MVMTGVQKRPSGDDTAPSPLSGGGDVVARAPMTPEHHKHWMKAYRTTIASSAGSVFAQFAAFPLDSVKTRMQAYDYRYKNFTDCVRHTYQTEGFKGFWRGALAPLFSVTLVRTSSFTIYQTAKYRYSAAIGKATGGDEPLVIVNRPGSTPTIATVACFSAAGATAGACMTVVACPFELTKVCAQLSGLIAKNNRSSLADPVSKPSQQQKGTFRTAKFIIENRGFAGMYSGFGFHLVRDTIGTAIYFGTYESTKQFLVKLQKSDSPTSPFSVAIAGGFCGVASWACIYPIDTAKAQYQRNVVSTAKGEGPIKVPKVEFFNPKRYSGMGVSMARSCVINTIFFSTFEFIKKRINMLPDPVLEPRD